MSLVDELQSKHQPTAEGSRPARLSEQRRCFEKYLMNRALVDALYGKPLVEQIDAAPDNQEELAQLLGPLQKPYQPSHHIGVFLASACVTSAIVALTHAMSLPISLKEAPPLITLISAYTGILIPLCLRSGNQARENAAYLDERIAFLDIDEYARTRPSKGYEHLNF